MAGEDTPMEEIMWRSPQLLEHMGGYLHSNNVLFYFAESPFFDHTSNNASLYVQGTFNDAMRYSIETREAFEGGLKSMQGLEFVVAYDPLQAAAQSDTRFAHEPSNIWVIRKQIRRKRAGMDDEVTVISTYYVVGDCVYMAPSVASVVGNRILSAVTSLSQLMKTASTLPSFTPSTGYTYLPPTDRTTESGQPTLQQSKENTPMHDAAPPPTVETQPSSKAGLGISTTSSNHQDLRSLAEAMNLFTRFGDEYMDENSLVGEPGAFIMSRVSGEADRAPAKTAVKAGPGATSTGTPLVPPGRVSTPQVRVDTPGKASDKSSSPPSPGENKGKRKKSRAAS